MVIVQGLKWPVFYLWGAITSTAGSEVQYVIWTAFIPRSYTLLFTKHASILSEVKGTPSVRLQPLLLLTQTVATRRCQSSGRAALPWAQSGGRRRAPSLPAKNVQRNMALENREHQVISRCYQRHAELKFLLASTACSYYVSVWAFKHISQVFSRF